MQFRGSADEIRSTITAESRDYQCIYCQIHDKDMKRFHDQDEKRGDQKGTNLL